MRPMAARHSNRHKENRIRPFAVNHENQQRRSDLNIMLSADELAFICNAINEALEAVDDWEFETRTGKSRAEAKAISAQLRHILDRSQS
jgi:hypothetical protein